MNLLYEFYLTGAAGYVGGAFDGFVATQLLKTSLQKIQKYRTTKNIKSLEWDSALS